MNETAKEKLDTMLGYLGFICQIEEMDSEHGPLLMVYSGDKESLIGRNGRTLDEIQYLLNVLVHHADRSAPRYVVDVEHWRQMREDQLIARAKQVADLVRRTGKPFHLDPMNSYDRRIVHNAFKDDPDVMTWSPPGDGRVKKITLKRRPPQA